MNSVAVGFVLPPLAHVNVLFGTSHDSVPVSKAIFVLPFVVLARFPSVNSFSMHNPLKIEAKVGISITEPLVALAMPLVLVPLPLIDTRIGVSNNAEPMPH